MVPRKPNVLILTAGFGDGHNSAARGIAEALEGKARCLVVDLFARTMPSAFKWARKGYMWTIAHAPGLWRQMFDWTDMTDMSVDPPAGLGAVERGLASLIEEMQPDAIISTYMVYPYMLDKLFAATGRRIPSMTVITDSLVINKTWLCSQTDAWAVTDPWTKRAVVDRGLDADHVHVTGFAVSPRLTAMARQSRPAWNGREPFRILYFPQGARRTTADMLAGMLSSHPGVCVTAVLGRNFRRYYPRFRSLVRSHPGRIILKGWSRKIPELMASHHLVVGKAGGATSHECIAMERPMLVNFRTPGQEEGNIELLERLGGGRFAETPAELSRTLSYLLLHDGKGWKRMHDALVRAPRPGGADLIAQWCLNPQPGSLSL